MTIKEEAIKAISDLPENAEFEEIMYRLYVINKIHKGQEAVKDNKVLSSEELKKEVQTW